MEEEDEDEDEDEQVDAGKTNVVSVCNGRGIRWVPTRQTTVRVDSNVEEEDEDKWDAD